MCFHHIYHWCCEALVSSSKVVVDCPEGRAKFMSIQRWWISVCVCVIVCVCLAFISRGWLFAWGQVLFSVPLLLPCSVSVCGDTQGDWKCSYTQGRTVDTHRNKARERSRSLTHSLCLLVSASLVRLFVIQVRFAQPNGPGDKCGNRHIWQLCLRQF